MAQGFNKPFYVLGSAWARKWLLQQYIQECCKACWHLACPCSKVQGSARQEFRAVPRPLNTLWLQLHIPGVRQPQCHDAEGQRKCQSPLRDRIAGSSCRRTSWALGKDHITVCKSSHIPSLSADALLDRRSASLPTRHPPKSTSICRACCHHYGLHMVQAHREG